MITKDFLSLVFKHRHRLISVCAINVDHEPLPKTEICFYVKRWCYSITVFINDDNINTNQQERYLDYKGSININGVTNGYCSSNGSSNVDI